MSGCDLHTSGAIEQYFYGELQGAERLAVDEHLRQCSACRELLDDLVVISKVLADVPDVSAPPGGDWTRFMARLEQDVRPAAISVPRVSRSHDPSRPRRYAPYLALAAMLTLVIMSIFAVLRDRDRAVDLPHGQVSAAPSTPPQITAGGDSDSTAELTGLNALTEQHFERSKLVVLGLATKDPLHASAADWMYERELASELLHDTRMYRLAAEEHGMDTVARVMRDLELVLLQTSVSEKPDPATLAQIQRVIRKRDLVTKMNVLTGL